MIKRMIKMRKKMMIVIKTIPVEAYLRCALLL